MKRMLHAIKFAIIMLTLMIATNAYADTDTDASQTYETMKEWAVDRMIMWARPGRSLLPEAVETFEDGKSRYGEIADALFHVVTTEKPLFGGKIGRIRTAALILSISMFESSYRKDVDLNIGKEGRGDGGRSWCLMQVQLGSPIYVDESGKRVTLVPICKSVPIADGGSMRRCEYVPPPGAKASTPTRIILTEEGGIKMTSDQTLGHSGQDLVADRKLCFAAGLRIVKNSFSSCRQLPLLERLSVYASGNCDDGREASRKRVGTAARWISSTAPKFNDEQLINAMAPPPPPPPDVSQTPIPVAFWDTP